MERVVRAGDEGRGFPEPGRDTEAAPPTTSTARRFPASTTASRAVPGKGSSGPSFLRSTMPSMAMSFATRSLTDGGCDEGSSIGFRFTYPTAGSTCKAMESSRASSSSKSSRVGRYEVVQRDS